MKSIVAGPLSCGAHVLTVVYHSNGYVTRYARPCQIVVLGLDIARDVRCLSKNQSEIRFPIRKIPRVFSGPQKGPAEGGHIKKRQKASKIFSTLFAMFRAGQKRQKPSKSVKNIFDTF